MNAKQYRRYKLTEEGRQLISDKRKAKYQRDKLTGLSSIRGKDPEPSIVAIDGEGLTDPDTGEHRFYLLAASTGAKIQDLRGLPTERCLQFLLSLWKTNRKIVGFSLGYDINQILKDLPKANLEELWQEEQTYWQGRAANWRIQWVPNKSFTITSRLRDENRKWKNIRTVTVWDCFGFFQSSFVRALIEWKIGTEEELDLIKGMKDQRAEFDASQLLAIEKYNDLECKLLVELIEALKDTLHKAGIDLQRWDGAGAVAGALLRKYKAKEFLPPPTLEIPDLAYMSAYYGGRIQAVAIGRFDGPIYNYDVNSAYPSTTTELPSLTGSWKEVTKYDPTAKWALWEVTWNVGNTEGKNPRYPLTPFPFRTKSGRIIYPTCGTGYYWSPLVKVAKEHWGKQIRVLRGWVYQGDGNDSPFEWVRELYEIRKEYKLAQDPRHIVLKLGLNSLYGKFAQGKGHQGKKPSYQCYIWAGLITATTQSKLLAAALTNPREMIAFATDGIFSRAPLDVEISSELGKWEASECDSLFLVQPGLYAYKKNGVIYRKTRGFRPSELDFKELVDGWNRQGYFYQHTIKVRRFMGLRMSLHINRLDQWRRFIETDRVITCSPGSGFPQAGYSGEPWVYWYPEEIRQTDRPYPYKPKCAIIDPEYPASINMAQDLDQPDPIM